MKNDGFASPEDARISAATRNLIRKELAAGTPIPMLVKLLMQQGLSRADANYAIDVVQSEAVMDPGTAGPSPAVQGALGLLGGVLAALLGGGVWAVLTYATNTELGIVAWGIGWLTGLAVVLFSRGGRGVPFQISAAVCAVLGIAIGKYGSLFLFANKEAGGELSPFDPRLIELFFTKAGEWFSGYDLLWVGLAVVTAFGIPKIRPEKAAVIPEEGAAAGPPAHDPAAPPGFPPSEAPPDEPPPDAGFPKN